MSMKINQDQIVPSRWQRIIFDYRRGKGHLISYLLNRIRWYLYPRIRYAGKLPDHVDIEVSSLCNMQCPMCYTMTDEFRQNVKQQFMDINLFKKIIDQCAENHVYSIRLSLRGESFIHPNIVEMIRYAKNRGIKEVSSLTNNLALNPEKFQEILDAGLDWLTISFDGVGETYEKIRRPAKFEDSYNKIKAYKKIKTEKKSVKPVIRIQSVWPAIKEDPNNFFHLFDPYSDEVVSNPLIDYLHKDTEIEYDPEFECPNLYQRMAIGSDGIVLLCSNDAMCYYPIGDANTQRLEEIWHGAKITEARAIHRNHRGVENYISCQQCYLPRKTTPVIQKIGDKKIVIDKYVGRTDKIGE